MDVYNEFRDSEFNLRSTPARKRAAQGNLDTGAKKVSTLSDYSTSHQSLEPNVMRVPKQENSLPKEQKPDQSPSLDQHTSVAKAIIDPKKGDSQLKEQNTSCQLPAGTSDKLSYVASHVTANFTESSNITAHSRPDPKTEQGKILFTINNISNLGTETKCSPYCTIANLPWRVAVKRPNDNQFISVFVYCNSQSFSNVWRCDADIQFQLLSSKNPFLKKKSHKFEYADTSCGFSSFLEWSQLIDPDNGYVLNDEVTFEVQITVTKIIGFRQFSEFNFVSDAPRSNSDVVLIVGGQRMRVCKHYLSMHSPVFHAMFFSEFIERDKKEIILEDIEPDQFLEMLHVVYPTHKPVTKINVDFLLKLGDRFEIQFVIDECERALVWISGVTTTKKLVYAYQYRLSKLQDTVLKTKIKGNADVKALEKDAEYKELTHETKSAILQRLLKL